METVLSSYPFPFCSRRERPITGINIRAVLVFELFSVSILSAEFALFEARVFPKEQAPCKSGHAHELTLLPRMRPSRRKCGDPRKTVLLTKTCLHSDQPTKHSRCKTYLDEAVGCNNRPNGSVPRHRLLLLHAANTARKHASFLRTTLPGFMRCSLTKRRHAPHGIAGCYKMDTPGLTCNGITWNPWGSHALGQAPHVPTA